MGIIHLFLSLSIFKMVCNPCNIFILSKLFIANIYGLGQHGNGWIVMRRIPLYLTDLSVVKNQSGVLGQSVQLLVAQDGKLGKIIITEIIMTMIMFMLMMKIITMVQDPLQLKNHVRR